MYHDIFSTPEVVAAIIIVVTGSLANGLWALHNLHVKAELRRMIDELKDYVRDELKQCVSKEMCNERNAELLRRLDAIGA
jgi:hypothetical protein